MRQECVRVPNALRHTTSHAELCISGHIEDLACLGSILSTHVEKSREFDTEL